MTLQHQLRLLGDRVSRLETKGLTKGALRLRFTLDERAAQAVYLEAARKAAAEGTATPEQGLFLAMQKDWDDAPEGMHLTDPNFIAGVDFYTSIGLLAPERRDVVLGITPE